VGKEYTDNWIYVADREADRQTDIGCTVSDELSELSLRVSRSRGVDVHLAEVL